MTELKVLTTGGRELTGLDEDFYSIVYAAGINEGRLEYIQLIINNMVREGCSWELIRKCVWVPRNLLPEVTRNFPDYSKGI